MTPPRGLRGDEEVSGVKKTASHSSGRSSAARSFTVHGEASNVQPKPALSDGRVLSKKATGKWKPSQARVKVRNYNVKDSEI